MAEELLLKALELTVSGVNYKEGQEELEKLRKLDEPGYLRCLLKLISMQLPIDSGTPSALRELEQRRIAIKTAACLLLKNAIRNHWETEQKRLTDASVVLLKESIIPVALESNQPHREILFESVRIMAQAQFPEEWPQPLPDLLQRAIIPYIQSAPASLKIIANAAELLAILLEKFLFAEASEDLLKILKDILACSQDKLAAAFEKSTSAIATAPNAVSPDTMRICLGSLKCIMYLHGVDLPEFFEDSLKTLMTALAYIISWRSESSANFQMTASSLPKVIIPKIVDTADLHSPDDDPWLTDQLKTWAFKLVGIYASRYTEEFQPYVALMTLETVVALCSMSGAESESQFHSQEAITEGITALNHALRTRWEPCHEPFSANVLQLVLQILIPQNMSLSKRDMEDMSEEPMNFITNDLSGFQRAAKRDSLQTLISNLIRVHPASAEIIIASCQNAMKADGQPLLKECACFLISALCNEATTRVRGVTQVRRKDDMLTYVQKQILPELGVPSRNDGDVLVISAYLKFLSLFRNFIPRELLEQGVRLALPLITTGNLVLHSYAAHFIEKILLVRYIDKQSYINKAGLRNELYQCLSSVQQKVQISSDFAENEFTMKLFWRLCAVCDFPIQDYAQVLRFLFDMTRKHCEKGGGNPQVLHYTFESIATLLMKKQSLSPDIVISLHEFAISVLRPLLKENSVTVSSYSYQLLAALINSWSGDEAPTAKQRLRAMYGPLLTEVCDLVLRISQPRGLLNPEVENLPVVAPSIVQCVVAGIYSQVVTDMISDEWIQKIVVSCDAAQLQNRKLKNLLNQQVVTLTLAWMTRAFLLNNKHPIPPNALIAQVMNHLTALRPPGTPALNKERNFQVTYCCWMLLTPNFDRAFADSVLAKVNKYALNEYEKFLCLKAAALVVGGAPAPTFAPAAEPDLHPDVLMENELEELSTSASSSASLTATCVTFAGAVVRFGRSVL